MIKNKSEVKRINKIFALLKNEYPNTKPQLDYSNPFELLIATILSAQCTDKRVNEVTVSLFARYKSTTDYASAHIKELESIIRPTGFYHNKAKAIIDSCKMLCHAYDGKVPSSMEELIKLPGVGRKTANVVLGGAFGMDTIAVDTHMLRVSKRLGLTISTNPEIVERDLMDAIPVVDWTRFNMALILHGRETCKARRPLCGECILFIECRWVDKNKYI